MFTERQQFEAFQFITSINDLRIIKAIYRENIDKDTRLIGFCISSINNFSRTVCYLDKVVKVVLISF
ncbi:Uncharacterised protein [Streptococcus pneumoniae]|nr:Uncharacterised protein [Streptococcus pneumoniae]